MAINIKKVSRNNTLLFETTLDKEGTRRLIRAAMDHGNPSTWKTRVASRIASRVLRKAAGRDWPVCVRTWVDRPDDQQLQAAEECIDTFAELVDGGWDQYVIMAKGFAEALVGNLKTQGVFDEETQKMISNGELVQHADIIAAALMGKGGKVDIK